MKVEFEYNAGGKPTGEANVDFSTHQEAKEAMKKHKANMRKFTFVLVLVKSCKLHLCFKDMGCSSVSDWQQGVSA